MPLIHVEFYGIPRSRAGVDAVDVPSDQLRGVLQLLAMQLPKFAEDCLDGHALRAGYLACINGTQFTTDGEYRLNDGDALLILSADVGGC